MAGRKPTTAYPVLLPNVQVAFFYRLQALRMTYMHEALKSALEKADLKLIDDELAGNVKAACLRKLAAYGVRGEVFFPTRCLLQANPFLLGYYRLLFGLSQKEFYNKGPFGKFRHLEEEGTLPKRLENEIAHLCASLIQTAEYLVERLDDLSLSVVHDLQLLTVGPQLRGAENTRIGQRATKEVFELIKRIVGSHIRETTTRTILVKNASGRPVVIEFLSDPDVRIMEKLPAALRPLVSIEVKGGRDASNIHNRIGEAEKSHQKAKNRGFFEFWTILRVCPLANYAAAQRAYSAAANNL